MMTENPAGGTTGVKIARDSLQGSVLLSVGNLLQIITSVCSDYHYNANSRSKSLRHLHAEFHSA